MLLPTLADAATNGHGREKIFLGGHIFAFWILRLIFLFTRLRIPRKENRSPDSLAGRQSQMQVAMFSTLQEL